MATKKQRRRREKLHRHEYEYVLETEEGKEIVVTPSRKDDKSRSGPQHPPGAVVDARGRVIQPPSWRRALKRGLIFGPIMLVFILFVGGGNVSLAAKIVNALVLIAIFIPFTYLMDRVIYRQVLKRQARATASRR